MKSRIPSIQWAFLIAFGVVCAGLLAYQALYVWPSEQCESQGDWWDPASRTCAVPMPISHFTGRKIGGELVLRRAAPAAAKP
jgi:hypothetical protein